MAKRRRYFPIEMLRQRRWLVRKRLPGKEKQPYSPLAECPDGYVPKYADEKPAAWRWRWNQSCLWVGFREAVKYVKEHRWDCEGVCFVLHPGKSKEKGKRIICLDFDDAFDPDGRLWPEIQDILDITDSYAEYSRSDDGLHLFIETECEPFRNILQATVNKHSRVDILCSAHVAMTGRIYEGSNEHITFADYSFLESLPYFVFNERSSGESDIDFYDEWWSLAEEGDELLKHPDLQEEMEAWPDAVQHHGRSKMTFSAACRILRSGIKGWAALRLLECVPTYPPFSIDELKHKIEDAYIHTKDDKSIDGGLPEFDDLSSPTSLPAEIQEAQHQAEQKEKQKQKEEDEHYRLYTLTELIKMDVRVNFVIDRAFIDQQETIIGGREKCFKTGIAADLAVSLTTGTKFLNEFSVLETRTVAFFTAEIGIPPARDLFCRILQARGLPLEATYDSLFMGDFVPVFQHKDAKTQEKEDAKLKRLLDRYGNPQVAIFDPLYLAMGGAAVGDMYEVGGVLQRISQLCRRRGIWPIFCHHAKKDASKEFQPMELADLYGSGVSAFARQWFLLAHQQPFSKGQANMFAKMGGSAKGDLDLWHLQITEGVIDELNPDRRWDVNISRLDESTNREMVKEDILAFLQVNDRTQNQLHKQLDWKGKGSSLGRILATMEADGLIALQGDKYAYIPQDETRF